MGFEQNDFEIVASYDHWEAAIKCYNRNFDHAAMREDLNDVPRMVELITAHEPQVIIGGPPCQEFSNAGRRQEGEKAELTIAYAKIVTALRPNYFVMENVPRIKESKAYSVARELYTEAGYGLTEVILDASKCGVPQKRSRFFCVGGLDQENEFLLGKIFSQYIGEPISVQKYFNNINYDANIEYYYRHPTTYDRRAVFSLDTISPTIRGVNRPRSSTYKPHKSDASTFENVRQLSTRERALIQTFPMDFSFDDLELPKCDIEQMIGNAVPVGLSSLVARCLIQYEEGDIMQKETSFAKWLKENKKYTDRTISDVFSRINRAKTILPSEKVDIYYIADLNVIPEYLQMASDIRSQIQRALKLLIEFENSLPEATQAPI